MSKEKCVLIIKHLPPQFTPEDIERFLKHFGATNVTVLRRNKFLQNSALAVFPDGQSSSKGLQRLHQLEILGLRLIAKYAAPIHESAANQEESRAVLSRPSNVVQEKKKVKDENKRQSAKDQAKEEQQQNGIAPKLGVKYSISPQLHYLYPPPSVGILTNIANAMATVPKFYTQVLHLMNKMNLPPPFATPTPTPPLPGDSILLADAWTDTEDLAEFAMSSEESELESDSEPRLSREPTSLSAKAEELTRGKRKLKQSRLQLGGVSRGKKRHMEAAEVFEPSTQATSKRIEFKLASNIASAFEAIRYPIHQQAVIDQREGNTALQDMFGVSEDVQESSGFGVIKPSKVLNSEPAESMDSAADDVRVIENPVTGEENDETDSGSDSSDKEDLPYLSRREILANRVSLEEILAMSQFSKYKAGDNSTKLYIKNLHKQTNEADLHRVFGTFIKNISQSDKSKFDIKLMKEGRMKGQAFITFPTMESARDALECAHGYKLHGKPIIIQFARSGKS